MAVEWWYKDAGTFRKAKEIWYRQSGAWIKLKEAWYRDAGTWRKVYQSAEPANFGGSYWRDGFGSSVSATVTFQSNGDISGSGTGSVVNDTITSDNWYFENVAGIGSNYWIRATLTGGSTPSGGTLNTWLQLSTGRQWFNNSGGGAFGSRTSTLLIEVASSSGGSPVVCSGTVTISASHES